MAALMGICRATREYEEWMGNQTDVVTADLIAKHDAMATNSFSFLRATFYRWAQQFPIVCPRLNDVPEIVAVGDIHIENYGLWRDAEGRLVWGVNDFDEAARAPYLNDLVRLATSAIMSPRPPSPSVAAHEILVGYRRSLERGGMPFVIAERHNKLHNMARRQLADPVSFWSKLKRLDEIDDLSTEGAEVLLSSLPASVQGVKIGRRSSGMGSLGRPRAVAIGCLDGASVAREVKRMLPSAWSWAHQRKEPLLYEEILQQAVRARDPFLTVHPGWVARRLSPDNCKLELAALGKASQRINLLRYMGAELANVHGAGRVPTELFDHSQTLTAEVLAGAAERMRRSVIADQQKFHDNYRRQS